MPAKAPGPRTPIKIRDQACLSVRFGDGACARCAEICPAGAIDLKTASVSVNDDCLTCGRCVAVCPTDALKIEGFALPNLSTAAAAPVFLDCRRVPKAASPHDSIRVPCLGGVAVGDLLNLRLDAGARPIRLLDRGWCRECPAGGAEHPAAATVAAVNGLLADMGVEERLRPAVVAVAADGTRPADHPLPARHRSRRVFLRNFARPIAVTEDVATSAVSARGKRIEPTGRLRSLEALTGLGARHGAPVPARFFPRVTIAATCQNHRVCVGLCPTGALSAYEDDARIGVAFDSARCIACGRCEKGCPEHAIALNPAGGGAPGRTPTVLTQHRKKACFACDDDFAASGDETLCPACRKSDEISRAAFALVEASRAIAMNSPTD